MPHELNEEQLKAIAGQLRCPSGDGGIEMANRMNINNGNMTRCAIASLELQDGDSVLEIGPGNGKHVAELFEQTPSVRYAGIDISETMVTAAKELNSGLCSDGKASFTLTDGQTIPFADGTFTKIFTVNTIYFWKDPAVYLAEIKRVLQPGGILCICFATKAFMQHLPFTSFGFELYETKAVEQLVTAGGWQVNSIDEQTEQVQVGATEWEEREFVVVKAGR